MCMMLRIPLLIIRLVHTSLFTCADFNANEELINCSRSFALDSVHVKCEIRGLERALHLIFTTIKPAIFEVSKKMNKIGMKPFFDIEECLGPFTCCTQAYCSEIQLWYSCINWMKSVRRMKWQQCVGAFFRWQIEVSSNKMHECKNSPFYSCRWKRGWSWPCFDTTLPALLCKSCLSYAN